MFAGEAVRSYFRDSDLHFGTDVVETYLAQLGAIGVEARMRPLPLDRALLAALNIMWLNDRGFIPQDKFNGPMFVTI